MIAFRKRGKHILGSTGSTLPELLVALATGMVILAALYRVFIFQDQVLGRQEGLMEGNQNVRNAMDIITRDFRMAGLGVPDSVPIITAADYQSVTFLVNYWGVSTKLTSQAATGTSVLNVDSITGFAPGQVIYISDGNTAESMTLTSNPGGSVINLPANLSQSYPAGSTVHVVDTVVFDYAGIPKEIRRKLNAGANEVFASDIDYVQIKYYDAAGNQISTLGTALTSAQRSNVRSTEVQVVARTKKQSGGLTTVSYEDGVTSYTDAYDRVYLKSNIRLRNAF